MKLLFPTKTKYDLDEYIYEENNNEEDIKRKNELLYKKYLEILTKLK